MPESPLRPGLAPAPRSPQARSPRAARSPAPQARRRKSADVQQKTTAHVTEMPKCSIIACRKGRFVLSRQDARIKTPGRRFGSHTRLSGCRQRMLHKGHFVPAGAKICCISCIFCHTRSLLSPFRPGMGVGAHADSVLTRAPPGLARGVLAVANRRSRRGRYLHALPPRPAACARSPFAGGGLRALLARGRSMAIRLGRARLRRPSSRLRRARDAGHFSHFRPARWNRGRASVLLPNGSASYNKAKLQVAAASLSTEKPACYLGICLWARYGNQCLRT